MRAVVVLVTGTGIAVMFDALGIFEGCLVTFGAILALVLFTCAVDLWRNR